MKYFYLLALSSVIFLAGCAADPAADKPKANVAEPAVKVEATPDTHIVKDVSKFETSGTPLKISAEESKIEFTGSKVSGKHDGGFKSFFGTIDLVDEKPESSKVGVDINMVTIYTDADGLTEHLKSADFFEVEKYPRASFVSGKITPDPAKGSGHYIVGGDFELHGVRKQISFPAQITVSPESVTVSAEFSINRKDFGIVYAGKADDLIRDDVVIRLDLKAPRK